jgi:hypothetical protein
VNNYLEECEPSYVGAHFPEINYTLVSQSLSLYCFKFNEYPLSSLGLFSLSYTECAKIPNDTLSGMKDKGIPCTSSTNTVPSVGLILITKQIGFRPEDENPFVNKTLKYYLTFTNAYVSLVQINWNLVFLNDDRGWLIDNIHNSTDLSPQPEVVSQTPTSTKLPTFSVSFAISDKYKTYNRTFIKLQDVVASILGFMQLAFMLMNNLSGFIKAYNIDMFIMSDRFEDTVIREKIEIIKPSISKSGIVIFNNSMQGN